VVHLGIDGGRIEALVAENLGHTLKGHPGTEHLRGGGMAKLVGGPQREMSPATRPVDNALDPLTAEVQEGSFGLQE